MKQPLLGWPVIEALQDDAPLLPLHTRLAWMAVIWTGSVAALLVVAMLLRLALKA
jgi:hypothetical protein